MATPPTAATSRARRASGPDGLTGDQRFFLAYAQAWRTKSAKDGCARYCLRSAQPPGVRVNGVVRMSRRGTERSM